MSLCILRLNQGQNEKSLPPAELSVEVRVETDLKQAFRAMQRALQSFRDEKRGPSYVALQSTLSKLGLQKLINLDFL